MRVLCAWVVCGWLLAGPMSGQQAETKAKSWQEAAGGKMSFEVASVRPGTRETFRPPSFPMSPDDAFLDPGGSFHSQFPVITYIQFAYKIWPSGPERQAFENSLPGWAKTDAYAIQARAPQGATKDQYRLMMQDLLEQRFGLRLHIEQRDEPVLLMTLEKPGQPGPKLTPHEQGPPCDAAPSPKNFPGICYLMAARPKEGMFEFASRATTLDLLGKTLASIGSSTSEIDRALVDATGLTGLWDFSLTIAPPPGVPGQGSTPATGPTLLEAIHEQLGLKLKPGRHMQPVPIVDHVDRPSEN